MPVSSITQFTVHESRFISNQDVFDTTLSISTRDSSNFFDYPIDLPPDRPNVEKVSLDISYISKPGIDDNGVTYFGNFILVPGQTTVLGNLTAEQQQTVLTNISFGGPSQNMTVTVNTNAIAQDSIQFFTLLIPFTEASTQPPTNNTKDYLFIDLDTTHCILPECIVSVDKTSNQLRIVGGNVDLPITVLILHDIATKNPPDPIFNYKLYADVDATSAGTLTIKSTKSINNTTIFAFQDSFFTSFVLSDIITSDVTSGSLTFQLKRQMAAGQGLIQINHAYDALPGANVANQSSIFSLVFGATSVTVNYSLSTPLSQVENIVELQSISANGAFGGIYHVSYNNPLPSTIKIEVAALPFAGCNPIAGVTLVYSTLSSAGITIKNLVDDINNRIGSKIIASATPFLSLPITSLSASPATGNGGSCSANYYIQFGTSTFITGHVSKSLAATLTYSNYTTIGQLKTAIQTQLNTWGILNVTISSVGNSDVLLFAHIDITQTDETISPSTFSSPPNTGFVLSNNAIVTYTPLVSFSLATGILISDLASSAAANTSLTSVGITVPQYLIDIFGSLSTDALTRASYSKTTTSPFFLQYPGSGSTTRTVGYSLENTILSNLVTQINSDWQGVISSDTINGSDNILTSALQSLSITEFDGYRSSLQIQGAVAQNFIAVFNIDNTVTVKDLNTSINISLNSVGIISSVDQAISSFPNALASSLDALAPINILGTLDVLTGTLPFNPIPQTVTERLAVSFNIRFARNGNPNNFSGLQVAFGGYQAGGVFFPTNAPNEFFEPVYNTLFPIQIKITQADIVYLLLRTRQNLEGTSYTSKAGVYQGMATYSNGFPNQSLLDFTPDNTAFINAWSDASEFTPDASNPTNVPRAIAVPVKSTLVNITLEDIEQSESIQLSIINSAEALNTFGFLGINRTNQTNSQTQSQTGRTYGLVLDNRGAWDVLISPEAALQKVTSGVFTYLNSSYSRTIIDIDEGYDFQILNPSLLPLPVLNSLSLSPVTGYPQVWALRIDPGIKQYLAQLKATAPIGSKQGCQIDVDMIATGRITGLKGIARVSIFYDYTCVYDFGLCGFSWDLIDPPIPTGPETIQNRLEINFGPLVDCLRLSEAATSQGILRVSVPWRVDISKIPTFTDGNALLLIKSVYTSEITSFYVPLDQTIGRIQEEAAIPGQDCPFLAEDINLMQYLNKEVLVLKRDQEYIYISDLIEIQQKLQTENSYMFIRPAFQFPPIDPIKDLGPNEIVVAGIGFQFKNWQNNFLTYTIILGASLFFSNELVYAPPEVDLSFRYYYNQLGSQ